MTDGGTVCNYRSMTGEDVVAGFSDLIFRGVSVVGFMLGPFLARRSPAEIRALYAEIAAKVVDGDLAASVEAVYPINEIGATLAHAQRSGRGGKILVAPNGLI